MPITLLDGILIGLMLVSGILAMIRGFSREVLSIASWAAAAFAAFKFYPLLSPILKPYTSIVSASNTLADGVSAIIIFLLVLIVVSLITVRIADFIVDSQIGPVDRTLGFLFGAARGVLLVVLGLMFFKALLPEKQPSWISEAKSQPMLEDFGNKIWQTLLDGDDEFLLDRFKSSDKEEAEGEGDAENQAGEGSDQSG